MTRKINDTVAGRLLFEEPETGDRLKLHCKPVEGDWVSSIITQNKTGRLYRTTITTKVLGEGEPHE